MLVKNIDIFSIISKDDVFEKKVGNSKSLKIITLVGVKKLARHFDVVEKECSMVVSPTAGNLQQHCVDIWVGEKGENDKNNWVRGVGEASKLNTGKIVSVNRKNVYQEWGAVDAMYRYSMATKRAYVRAVLSFLGLFEMCGDCEFVSGEDSEVGDDLEIDY